MANVLTDLAADIYKAADVVSRELVGFIPASTINGGGSERAAVGDTVRSHFTRAASAVDNSPSMTIPEGTDQTVDNKTLSISKSKGVQIPWTGEDMRHVNNGSGFETIYGDQIAQAMRTLTNLMEADLAAAARIASRAYGTAGTTPFASDLSDSANVRKILADNGCPMNDGQLSLVMDTVAGAKMRSLAVLNSASDNASDAMLRQGVLLDVHGMMMRESAQVESVTAGGITGTVTVTGANAVGATTINVTTAAGAAVALSAGDIITFAGDSNKYIVASAATIGASATGDIVIAEPGLRVATTGSEAVSDSAAFTANVAFHRTALELAVRPPAMPAGGDAAVDMMTVVDPRSGIAFEVSAYKGFQKAMFNVSAAWGVKLWKPEHAAILLG